MAREASGTEARVRSRRKLEQSCFQIPGLARARGLQPARARRAGRKRRPMTWLVCGVRTPFARVDGPFHRLDAVALSVPVAKAMAAQLGAGDRSDLLVWGTVVPGLGWSNIAREVQLQAGIDPSTPAFSTVLACSTSMAAVFEAAGLLGKDVHVAMCGGVESMSRVQIGVSPGLSDWIRRLLQARSFGDRIDRFLELRAPGVQLR